MQSKAVKEAMGYMPTSEEQRAVDLSEPAAFIRADNVVWRIITAFATDIGAVQPGENARDLLQPIVDNAATELWSRAKTYSLGGVPDDRILYWARLKMLITLNSHPQLLANNRDRDFLVERFEKLSRNFNVKGRMRITFTADKKNILITGFDPYGLHGTGIVNDNPSGAIALALDDVIVTAGATQAHIRSAIFPVRFKDFDDGIVEDFIHQYLYTAPVDMIVTISQNGRRSSLNIERFAARERTRDYRDNNDAKAQQRIGADADWREFYETTLPFPEIMPDAEDPYAAIIFNNQSYGHRVDERTVYTPQPGLDANALNSMTLDAAPPTGKAVCGSGGAFLSNEIFYRVAHHRDEPPPPFNGAEVKTGHLHVPAARHMSGRITTADIINIVRAMLVRTLPRLS